MAVEKRADSCHTRIYSETMAILSFPVFLRIYSLSGIPILCLPQSPFTLISKRGYAEDSFAIVALPKTHTFLKEG